MKARFHRCERGSTLPTVLCFILILSVLGLGAASLVPFEASSVRQLLRSERALYVAEAGLEYGKAYLEAKFPSFPSEYSETRTLPTGSFRIQINPQYSPSSWIKEYEITSIGTAGNSVRILRSHEKAAAFSKYAYFTDREKPPGMNQPIWFASWDTLAGPVHSNDQIHIMGDPTFTSRLTSAWGGPDDPNPTHWPSFMYYNGSSHNHVMSAEPHNLPYDYPTFGEGYELGVGMINLPENLIDLKGIAQEGGLYVNRQCQIEFSRSYRGSPLYGYVSYRVRGGGRWGPWTDLVISSMPNPVIFVDGIVYVSGVVDGQITLVSSQHVRITDDLVYRESQEGIPSPGCDDMLGIIAEHDVVVQDTGPNRSDVNINASILAVKGSFKVKNYDRGHPRGSLRVVGGIIQNCRGPVGNAD